MVIIAIIGEAYIAIRPLTTGFGTATKAGVDSELAATDLFGGVRTQSAKVAGEVESDAAKAGKKFGDSMEAGAGRVSSVFDHLGSTLSNWGIPFAGSIGKIGNKIDGVDTKGKKFGQTLSSLGGLSLGVGAIAGTAIAAESVHLAVGLQAADAQIASHENISVTAANNIGKAFVNTAGTSIFSANQMSEAFVPVSGELRQIHGSALTAGQSLQFLTQTGNLAEATGGNLASTTATVASIMQAFQVPLKGTTKLVNDLFNTSRVTGVGVDSLGSTIDRLKSRLGVAAPTVADLSSLLVDLNEHGVQGSRGLLVVNSAINTLLQSVPKVDAATAKAANTLSTKLGSASTTAASATAAVAKAQADGLAKVQAAQLRLQQTNERIAASSTAGAPTTSQQISVQNATLAVTKAQEAAATAVAAAQGKQATAQGKITALQATAGVSTNAQVLAMQQLGLQVYNASGKFIGMRDVIAQLQPKLATMTQQQQLLTLSQVFGTTASKSLLDTVLAGPAAYDRARKAVTDSSTAQKGAEKQSQTLKKEVDLIKASLIDEGDKLGIFLIPKLQTLGKWTIDITRDLGKHKTAVEAVAIAFGSVLAVAVGAFTINEGAKFLKFLTSAGDNVGKLLGKITGSTSALKAAEDQQAADAKAAADNASAAQQQIAEAAANATGEVATSVEGLSTSINGFANVITAALDRISTGFRPIPEAAGLSTSETDDALEGMVEVTRTSSGLIIAANERTAASFRLIPEAAAAAVPETEASQAAILGRSRSYTNEIAGAEAKTTGLPSLQEASPALLAPEEAAATGVTLGSSAGAILTKLAPAAGGLIAVQLYDSFAEKDVGKAIGTKAASVIGDVGTGAAIGAGIGSVVPVIGTGIGTVAGGVIGAIISQRADFSIIKQDNADIARDHREDARNNKIIAAAKANARSVGGSLSGENSQSGVLTNQTAVLSQLQAAVTANSKAFGAGSPETEQALKSLYATENKWLPGLSKETSTAKVSAAITAANAKLQKDTATQAIVQQNGTLTQANANLVNLKNQLAQEKAGRASESTLQNTRTEITGAKNQISSLNSIAKSITKDQTTITNDNNLKAEMEKVNNQVQSLKKQIATTAPPKIQSKGTVNLKVHR